MTTLPWEPEPPPRQYLRSLICWAVIFGVIGTILWTQHRHKNRVADKGVMTDLQARYVVGIKILYPGLINESSGLRLVTATVKQAQTPAAQLRLVPFIAEIYGKEAALQKLDELDSPSCDDAYRGRINLLRQVYNRGQKSLTPDQRKFLEGDWWGWMGRLALAYDLPADDPSRRAVTSGAVRTTVIIIAAFLGAAGALLAGVVLLIIGIVFFAIGKLRFTPAPSTVPSSLLLESFAIYMAGFVGMGWVVHWLLPGIGFGAYLVILPVILLAGLWPRIRGMGGMEFRQAIGWHRGRGVVREMGAGLLGYLAGLPIMAAGWYFSYILIKHTGAKTSHPIVQELGSGRWDLLKIFLLACVWAPVVEETFFRGALFQHLRRQMHWLGAACVVACIFAIIHPQGPAALPALGSIALVLALIRQWRSSLIASMTAHAMNNFAVMILLVLVMR